MFRMFQYVFFIFSLSSNFVGTSQSWHTSQHALTKLYNLQIEQFDVFNNYLNLEEKRLEELKSNLAAMGEWYSYINSSDTHNHVNNMKAMIRIHDQLRKLEDLILSKDSTEVLKQIDEHKDLSEDQVLNAQGALRRLQKFYMITASDMARGSHNNRNVGDRMDACECYVMAKYCFKEQDMYCVTEWAIETLDKWKKHGQPKCVDIEKLHLYIVSSSVHTGFDFTTLLNPDELQISDDTEKFKRFFLMRQKDTNLLDSGTMAKLFGTYNSFYKFRPYWGEGRFRELCQYNAPVRILTKHSKCRYQTRNSAYRLLMPFKEEDVSNDPYVKIYHDVLYDGEILNLKKLASENMKPAEVTKLNGSAVVEDHRSGQVSRVSNYEASQKLNARIEAFTGYSTKTAENYQIVNYGLGGHYIPHLDAFGVYNTNAKGDRVLTVLFYMNDVPNDGSTVFPFLDVISPCEKGAALVWVNLNMTDGSRLMGSLHGACPVLKGNKWIMTKWLLEEGQNLPYDWRKRNNKS